MKKVTIIVPTYNDEKRIENCLLAIFKQDYPKKLLQVIISDGGSSDNTVAIAKKMGAEIIKNKLKVEEYGKPLAIKKLARGEIIGLLDSDNIIPQDKFWLKK